MVKLAQAKKEPQKTKPYEGFLPIGCHVSAAGGVFNAPKNAAALGCETFQIFTRPPMGGPAPKIDEEVVSQFKEEMERCFPSSARGGGNTVGTFVVHCPYFVNFGSGKKQLFHGSSAIVSGELKRADMLGAKYTMTHLGSFKDLGPVEGMKQAREGLKKVLTEYEGKTQFLLEIAAGAGEVIGKNFEELAELMELLVKFKTFGGICMDTQHAFSAGYDISTAETIKATFTKFDKAIGLKWLKMSHVNDSKIDLGGRKDRHEHIGEGKIGEKGFGELLKYLDSKFSTLDSSVFPLILETEHDKVEQDIEILKKLRNKI
jgi:deoxyribonuclease-4